MDEIVGIQVEIWLGKIRQENGRNDNAGLQESFPLRLFPPFGLMESD